MSQISQRIYDTFRHETDRPAVSINRHQSLYRDILNDAHALHRVLEKIPFDRIAILGDRTRASYAGVAYALFSAKAFVPINPFFPAIQNQKVMLLSECNVLLFDLESWKKIEALITGFPNSLVLVLIDYGNMPNSLIETVGDRLKGTQHKLEIAKPRAEDPLPLADSGEEQFLYIMFTSGTTGVPKGVPVSHRNVEHYLSAILTLADLSSTDRFSQFFDLTFDLSMHDILLTWLVGGCLCVPSRLDLVAPRKYIEKEGITIWFSVPSAVALMRQIDQLQPESYPGIRYSFFCGEAMPANIALAWQAAASRSRLINLYGPTEATIAFTSYELTRDVPAGTYPNGILPLGHPFGENLAFVVNDSGHPIEGGEQGELCLAGPQLTSGYLNDATQNAERFFTRKDNRGKEVRWYRTGDRAAYDEDMGYVYYGRLDTQVKILGYRVELLAIESVLREVSGCAQVAAMPWPVIEGIAKGIVACVVKPAISSKEIIKGCKERLSFYQVPSEVHVLDSMPLNANGKTDRNALKTMLEGMPK